jgi:hypothetical protein
MPRDNRDNYRWRAVSRVKVARLNHMVYRKLRNEVQLANLR